MQNSSVKVTKKKSFLGLQSKSDFVSELINTFKGRCYKAYIFGSFFSDKFHSESDLDLILIADSKRPFIERALDFPELLDFKNARDIPLDLLIYTTLEWEKLVAEGESHKVGFWPSVVKEMQIIYEKDSNTNFSKR